MGGAFDAAQVLPGWPEGKTLGDCPCQYTIPARSVIVVHLLITLGKLEGGTHSLHLKVYHEVDSTTRPLLAGYQVEKEVPVPASATDVVGRMTHESITLTWPANAQHTFIIWGPSSTPDTASQSLIVTMGSSYTISGLTPSTEYRARVIRVQTTGGAEASSQQVLTLTTDPYPGGYIPRITPHGEAVAACDMTSDYDIDDDGLIEVCSLQQLDAIRHDLDGDGAPDVYPTRIEEVFPTQPWRRGLSSDFSPQQRFDLYAAAFPGAVVGMGCPATGCIGYELAADLDFNQNGMPGFDGGVIDAQGALVTRADPFWNDGKGWLPIMGQSYLSNYEAHGKKDEYCSYAYIGSYWPYEIEYNLARKFVAVFEGNGHTIANLSSKWDRYCVGLFGYVGPGGQVRNVGLIGTGTVSGARMVGGLVGGLVGVLESGTVSGSYSRLNAFIPEYWNVGGLVGLMVGAAKVRESYATGDVSGGHIAVGGLVGMLAPRQGTAQITASFATGDVSGISAAGVGGLVGYQAPTPITQTIPGSTPPADAPSAIIASYATGDITAISTGNPHYAQRTRGGALVGRMHHPTSDTTVASSYATGTVTSSGEGPVYLGGLFGGCPSGSFAAHTYWQLPGSDLNAGVNGDNVCGWSGKTASDLQSPIETDGYAGVFSTWNVDVDSDGAVDDPWDFGTSSQYPKLDYCGPKPGIDLSWDSTRTVYCPLRESADGHQQR